MGKFVVGSDLVGLIDCSLSMDPISLINKFFDNWVR